MIICRRLAEQDPGAHLPNVAGLSHNLALALCGLGRYEEALAAIRESVATWRQLAEHDPDAYRFNLVISLNYLTNLLRQLGRQEEAAQAAQEAAQILPALAPPTTEDT